MTAADGFIRDRGGGRGSNKVDVGGRSCDCDTTAPSEKRTARTYDIHRYSLLNGFKTHRVGRRRENHSYESSRGKEGKRKKGAANSMAGVGILGNNVLLWCCLTLCLYA